MRVIQIPLPVQKLIGAVCCPRQTGGTGCRDSFGGQAAKRMGQADDSHLMLFGVGYSHALRFIPAAVECRGEPVAMSGTS